jgi:hypothetical protein
VGEESEGIPFYEQVPGRATAHHAALPAPHPPRGGPQPRRRLLGRMPGLREARARTGDVRGGEGRLLRGQPNGARGHSHRPVKLPCRNGAMRTSENPLGAKFREGA